MSPARNQLAKSETLEPGYFDSYRISAKNAEEEFEQFLAQEHSDDDILNYLHDIFSSYSSDQGALRDYFQNHCNRILEIGELRPSMEFVTISHLIGTWLIERNKCIPQTAGQELIRFLKELRERMSTGMARNGHKQIVSELNETDKFQLIDRVIELLASITVKIES